MPIASALRAGSTLPTPMPLPKWLSTVALEVRSSLVPVGPPKWHIWGLASTPGSSLISAKSFGSWRIA